VCMSVGTFVRVHALEYARSQAFVCGCVGMWVCGYVGVEVGGFGFKYFCRFVCVCVIV